MNEKGFTLVELMIAIAVSMVIMLAIYAAMELGQRSSSSVVQRVITQQDTRAVLDLMAMEIRMASFNPTRKTAADNMWKSPADCNGAGVQVRKGIQVATAGSITIEMDSAPIISGGTVIGYGDGVIGGTNGPSEIINYNYDSGTSTITRATNCGNAQTILGGAGFGTTVQNNAAVISMFRYYDKTDTEITSLTDSTIPTIRRIEITIVADTEYMDQNTRRIRRMIYSTNVNVRNHVLSP